MDVSCPQCDTLYEFDPRQLRGAGVTLKCSQCGHAFRLETDQSIHDESQRRWMVRQKNSGDILYFASFDILHQWIMDGSISGDDAISRTGKKWTRLADIGEFTPIFQVVASIAEFSQATEQADSDKSAPTAAGAPVFERKKGGTDPRFQAREPLDTPSPSTENPKPAATPNPATDTTPMARRRKQTTPQFRGVSDSSPAADLSETSAPPAKRPARRPMQRTVPGKPGGTSEQAEAVRAPQQTPAPAKSDKRSQGSTGTTGSGTGPGDSDGARRPQVHLEDRRLQSRYPSSSQDANKVSDRPGEAEPTLGEMEFGGGSSGTGSGGGGARRGLIILAIIVAGAVGVALWQADQIENWWAERTDAGAGGAATVADADDHGQESSTEVVDPAAQAIGEALDAAQRANLAAWTTEAIAAAEPGVEEALAAARQAVERQDKPSAAEIIAGGQRSLDRENPDQAIERFEFALAESPNNSEALIGLGWAYLLADDPDQALREFLKAKRIDPSAGEALIGIGRAERERGRLDAALRAYDDYLERFPSGSQASIARYQSEQLRRSLSE